MKHSILLAALLLSTNLKADDRHHNNKKPEAKLKLSEHECKSPCTITLDGTKSEATKGKSITKYIFDLGNGETIESTTPSIEYTYINFVEDKDPKKKEKYKKWKKFIDWCHTKFKKYEKFEPSLKVVQSDNQTSKADEKKLLVKGTDILPTIDGDDLVPPKPNQVQNNSTLAGIDVDGDNVRDDIELWINGKYSSSNQISSRRGLKQIAKYAQLGILNTSNKEESIRLSHLRGDSIGCLHWVRKSEAVSLGKELRLLLYNTKDRIKANLQADLNFHGQSKSTRWVNTPQERRFELCEFPATQEIN